MRVIAAYKNLSIVCGVIVESVFSEATLYVPDDQWMIEGGRDGRHSEHFGSLIAEMQTMQRSYPGQQW
jgi:ring-1,2-phenylacetyl-CoA epoxidase subunit PaaC